jgi:L-arabinose isomerase
LDAIALGEQEPPDFLRSQKIGIFPGLQDLRESGRSLKLATETDVRSAVCLLLFEYLGLGATMCEAWMIDFPASMILLGHDGPPDLRIARSDKKARLTFCHPWMEGTRGRGCVIECGAAPGDATLIMLAPSEDSFCFVVAEGRIPDLPTLPLGMPNFWFIPDVGVSTFYQRWTQLGGNHHFVIALGRLSTTIEQISALLHLKAYKV